MYRLTFVALLALAGTAAHEPPSRADKRCSLMPMPQARSAGTTVLLARPAADTLLAGPGTVAPGRGGHAGTGAPGPIYGQVVEAQRFGGADSARLAHLLALPGSAHVLVVPWDYDGGCQPSRWTTGFPWLPVGEPGTLTVKLRPASMWLDGMPVFDAFIAQHQPYPASFRNLRRRRGATLHTRPWMTPDQNFDLMLAMPEMEDWVERPHAAWSAADSWRTANPVLAEMYPANELLAVLGQTVARAKARRVLLSIAPPVVGTYRMSAALNGQPARTFYMRTRAHPSSEWRPPNQYAALPDPNIEPDRPHAYNMIASVAADVSELPANCDADRQGSAEGYVYVIDPPALGGAQARTEWDGWLESAIVARAFRSDSVVHEFHRQAFVEWGGRWQNSTELEAPARYWYDGGVLRVEQTTRLQDGRELVVRGERISDVVIDCSW